MRKLYGNYIHIMKKKGRGRTSRQRRRKLFRTSDLSKVSEGHKSEFIELRKWLKERKFKDHNLRPARFSGTGRGLMAVKSLQPGELIISLPEKCLLTTDTVIKSYLGAYITKWTPPVSPLLALCAFLISEKHTGNKSPWKPYLDILPKTYTCLVCLEPQVVKAAFNEKTHCYEIRTTSSCKKYEELFICYGPHDNHQLLLEYGFVAINNPHSAVYISVDDLVDHLPSVDTQMNKKISLLKEHGFSEDLTFGCDGPSWRLLTALKLLCLGEDEFTCWKKVLLGEVISNTNEWKSLVLSRKVCSYYIEEAKTALQKVSHMKDEEPALKDQLTLIENLWIEELKLLQVSADILKTMHQEIT
ncbi:SET domain-containing protein 4 isoform X4 [Petaurus breviceps papuanus]|uniref:SET domain-containing protein 4 isoform X4 n=1 Tax=Petaurus breviceps papuanus TaxID=3040969 RepID=UPI0036DA4BC1